MYFVNINSANVQLPAEADAMYTQPSPAWETEALGRTCNCGRLLLLDWGKILAVDSASEQDGATL